MPSCPNCGRQTLRTKDWACQWCGYPLLSRSYKKIDKTFRELQDERSGVAKAAPPEPGPAVDLDAELDLAPGSVPEPAPQPEPVPLPEPRFKIAPEPPPKPEPEEPLPELPPTPDDRARPKAAFRPEPVPGPQEPLPDLPPTPDERVTPKAALKPEHAPGPERAPAPPEAESALPAPQIASPSPAPQLASQPRPKPLPELEPPPVVAPALGSINEGSVLTVDELDALYKADRAGAHDKLSGKTIVIRGLVEKVFIRDHIDVRYIVLTGSRKKVLWPVRCNFGKDGVSRMSRLTEGQEVSLRGKYDSYGKNIIFKECELV